MKKRSKLLGGYLGVLFLSVSGQLISAQTPAIEQTSSKLSASLTEDSNTAWIHLFEKKTQQVSGQLKQHLDKPENFLKYQAQAREQLAEMLGLSPRPAKTDLQAKVESVSEIDGVIVEKIHFQALPGLYVTANLFRPKEVKEALPTVLYVCGHADVKKDGVSIGNKAGYAHHGIWYAKHGFVCMSIDTVQLGEIRGEHAGTYRLERWWWMSRGYTPAGVEAWSGIRALDYLETRAEVDSKRFGVAGRSGGGAYSWWIAALDERIQCAVPTAGITNMHDHVVEGKVTGHCDCMFMVNTYRWDYDQVAALIAPRPLLIANTDKDSIFSLEGVVDVHSKVRDVYRLLGKGDQLGLHIAEGPHANMQPLNVGEFHWMQRFLQKASPMSTFDSAAKKLEDVAPLRVFKQLPEDQLNTTIDRVFVKQDRDWKFAVDAEQRVKQEQALLEKLKQQSFQAMPAEVNWSLGNSVQWTIDGVKLSHTSLLEENGTLHVPHPNLRAHIRVPAKETQQVTLHVLDAASHADFMANLHAFENGHLAEGLSPERIHIWLAPQGIGSTAWEGDVKSNTHFLRRFYLLGETLHSTQVADIRGMVQAILKSWPNAEIEIEAQGEQGVNALFASILDEKIQQLRLRNLPETLEAGPYYLNVMKYMDLPHAVELAGRNAEVILSK